MVSGRLLELGFPRHLLRAAGGDGPAPAGAVVVDRLAMRDREQPGAQVARVLQARVGAQGGDEGLLEAVLGVVGADGRHQEPEHVGAVLIHQRLKRWKGLI